MILTDEPNLREVNAFPMTSTAEEIMTGAPRPVEDEQLLELGIGLLEDEKERVFNEIINLLDTSDVEYELMEHQEVKTSQQAAEVRGTPMSMAPKAMIFKKKVGSYIMICVPADREVDVAKVQKVVGEDLQLASPEDVEMQFGVKVGAVPPFGKVFGMEMYMDKVFWEREDVVFNAGRRDRSIKMKAADLIKLTNPVESSEKMDFKK
jgi:prolyl-tRNA editing enzyme YbaK/EbsC (Cys-tRNA(Pro) deacylase)